jgi:hypothetical protein
MSLGSPADVMPFARVLVCHQRLQTNSCHDRPVGHTVGVIAIVRAANMHHRDSFTSAIGSSTRARATFDGALGEDDGRTVSVTDAGHGRRGW